MREIENINPQDAHRSKKGRHVSTNLISTFSNLKTNQSFLEPCTTKQQWQRIREAISKYAKRHGIVYTTIKMPDGIEVIRLN